METNTKKISLITKILGLGFLFITGWALFSSVLIHNTRIDTAQAAQTPGVWQQVLLVNNGSGAFGIRDVVNDKNRPSDFYAASQNNGSGYLAKSTDYGQTWNQITPQSGSAALSGLFGLSMAPSVGSGPATLFIGAGSGFWKSTDGGLNWTNYTIAPAPSGRPDVYAPAVDPYDPTHLIMAAHEQNTLYQSTNAGQTWSSVSTNSGMATNGGTAFPFFIDTGTASGTRNNWMYIPQDTGGSWRTTNGGASWTQVSSCAHLHGTAQIYQPDTSGVVYEGGEYCGIMRSTDYGFTWSPMWAQNTPGFSNHISVVFGTPNKVYGEVSFAGGCCAATDPGLAVASQPGTSGLWTHPTPPSGMTMGAGTSAVAYDGTNWIIVTANWYAGLWRYVEPASGNPPPPPPPGPTPPPPGPTPPHPYTTNFPLTENPISEGGFWLNGLTDGLDWADVRTTPGKVFGTQTGSSSHTYNDSIALLKGTWGPDQDVSATVFNDNLNGDYNAEVELRLRATITPNNSRGYEVNFRAKKDFTPYMEIARWNGPLGNSLSDFTFILHQDGAQYGVATGDVIRATMIGNVITVYKNGVQMGQGTDNTYATGSPGVGFYLRNISQNGNPASYGFSSFTATDIISSSDTTPPTVSISSPANGATVSGSSVAVTSNAADNIGVAGVQFKLDGNNLGSEDTSAPYSFTWNSTGTSNGTHTLSAVARDTSNNMTTSSTISVTVNNGVVTATPFNGPHNFPGKLEAEDFDNGGEGVAYHDIDAGNNGNSTYRSGTDVDLETTGDAGGGSNIAYARMGEWINYTVGVATTGNYDLAIRVADLNPGGTFHVEVDGVNKTGTMTIPSTGAWQTYTTITKTGVSLTSGTHSFRLFMDSNGTNGSVGNFNYFNVTSSGGATPVVGDINQDHIVNAIDYSILNSHWFGTDAASDLNHDGIVNAIDFSMLNANWFKTW